MRPLYRFFAVVLTACCASLLPADDAKPAPADGFEPLFNGKNLDGWVNVNCAPDTFFVKGDEVVTTGKPTGFLRTTKQYENFVLEMDWMHVNTKEVGNSGLFVWGDPLPAVGTPYTRGIEVQVLVNLEYKDKQGRVTATSHGDLFSIWGAACVPDRPHPSGSQRCLPSENRARGGGEWNHYRVTANDGVIKLEVNGKGVSGVSKCNPRKGYLALESEGAECHFKNIRIKELPSTNPKPAECAKVAEGHVSLFNGVNLKGWKAKNGGWKANDGVLACAGDAALKSEKELDQYELIFDWKLPAKSDRKLEVSVGELSFGITPDERFVVATRGSSVKGGPVTTPRYIKPGGWTRVRILRDNASCLVSSNGDEVTKMTSEDGPVGGPITFTAAKGLEIMNVFVRELKEKK
jgi:hypothetical protein